MKSPQRGCAVDSVNLWQALCLYFWKTSHLSGLIFILKSSLWCKLLKRSSMPLQYMPAFVTWRRMLILVLSPLCWIGSVFAYSELTSVRRAHSVQKGHQQQTLMLPCFIAEDWRTSLFEEGKEKAHKGNRILFCVSGVQYWASFF